MQEAEKEYLVPVLETAVRHGRKEEAYDFRGSVSLNVYSGEPGGEKQP